MISLLKSKFDTASRRALFLSSDKLAVYHWDEGKLGSSYLFDFSVDGQRYFDRYLKESEKMTTYLLVDMVEEEFRPETIPHTSGSDREAIIERKKARLFRDTPYFYADIQGRETEGRRDDKVLFMALTNPDLLVPWLKIMDSNKVPLAGIYSLPQITSTLLDKLPEQNEHELIVSLQSISGLRQTYFRNKKIKVSRLVDLPRYGTVAYSPIVKEEVTNIHRYLNSLNLMGESSVLNIYYLCDTRLIDEIKKDPHQTENVKNHYININEFNHQIGLNRDFTTPFSDPIFVHQLLKIKPINYYAQKPETRYFKLQQAGRMMYISSLLLVFGSLIWGSINFINGVIYKQQAEISAKKTSFYYDRYNIAREKLPHTPVEAADLKLVVEASQTLNDYNYTPFDTFKVISASLDKFPEIVLDDITWNVSKKPETGDKKKNKKQKNTKPDDNLPASKTEYDYFQNSEIKAHIENFDGNYRNALAMINNFTENIRATGGVYQVEVLKLPLDTSSEANLSGEANSGPGDSSFSINVALGYKHE